MIMSSMLTLFGTGGGEGRYFYQLVIFGLEIFICKPTKFSLFWFFVYFYKMYQSTIL